MFHKLNHYHRLFLMLNDIVGLLNMIPELVLILLLGFGGYKLYIAYSKTANLGQSLGSVFDEVSDTAQKALIDSKEVLEDLTDMVTPQVSFDFDTAILATQLSQSAMLKSLTFGCQQKVSIKQTGNREVSFFGFTVDVPLEGFAEFEYNPSFSGDIEFDTAKLTIEQLEGNIQITLPVPVIYISEMKFNVTKDSGNLSKKELARRKGQEALDKVDNYPYFFSLYFMSMEHGEKFIDQLLEQANDYIESVVKGLVTKLMAQVKPGVSYDVFVSFSGNPDKVVVYNGSGGTYSIPFSSIEAATIQNIIDDFGASAPNTQIEIKKLEGSVNFATAANTIQVV